MFLIKENPIFVYKDFRNLFFARVISAIGDKFFTLSLLWWVIDSGNKLGLSLVMAATFMPVVLFSPFMGTLSDRHNKKYLMIIADLARALVLFIILILLVKNLISIEIILLLIFLLYSFAPLFETSTASSILPLTSQKHLSKATAIDSSSIGISNVIGAMLGSVFIALLGFKGSVGINILAYLLSFVFVLRIKKNLKNTSEISASYADDLKLGFKYIKDEKTEILKILIYFAILNFFVSPILLLIPVIVKFILIREVGWLAITESFFASGVLFASFVMSFKKDVVGNIRLLIYTIFVFSISFFITGVSKNPYLTSFFLFICGFSISAGNVAIVSYFQYSIENEYKGRFFSLVNTVVYAIMPISFIVNGFLIEKFEPSYVIYFNSVVSCLIGMYGILRFKDIK